MSPKPIVTRTRIATTIITTLVILLAFLGGKALAREGAIHPVKAPDALVKARAACPTDSVPCLHGKLRLAYESIAWQRAARQHAQATTVQAITRDAIAWAAAKYHVSASDMTSVAVCESHLWPFATNGQYAGAWQLSSRHRSDPIFLVVPWQDAYAEASHVARYVKAHGWSEWQCQPGGGLRW